MEQVNFATCGNNSGRLKKILFTLPTFLNLFYINFSIMKNLNKIVVWLGVFLLYFSMNTDLSAQSFRQGELTISPGVGIFNLGTAGFPGFNSLPVVVTGEYGLTDQFGAGAFVGVRYWFGGSADLSPSVSAGIRGVAHLFPILNSNFDTEIDDSQIDVYLALNAGLELRPEFRELNQLRAFVGPVLGGKFYLTDNFGLFVELGAGALSYTTGGLVIRIGGN